MNAIVGIYAIALILILTTLRSSVQQIQMTAPLHLIMHRNNCSRDNVAQMKMY